MRLLILQKEQVNMNYGKFINESIVINPSEISLDGKHYEPNYIDWY